MAPGTVGPGSVARRRRLAPAAGGRGRGGRHDDRRACWCLPELGRARPARPRRGTHGQSPRPRRLSPAAPGSRRGPSAWLATAGVVVAIVDRQEDKANALAAEIGRGVVAIGPILAPRKVARRPSASARCAGGLDILVNNAHPRETATWWAASPIPTGPSTNSRLRAAAAMAEAALADLTASAHGAIVNVSSILATSVGADQNSLAYHVSKAGLDQFTRWLAVRCGPSGVRVMRWRRDWSIAMSATSLPTMLRTRRSSRPSCDCVAQAQAARSPTSWCPASDAAPTSPAKPDC